MSDNDTTQNVPDFSVHGFAAPIASAAIAAESVETFAVPSDVHAAKISACVSATYDNGKVCFTIPIIGKKCVSVPVHIPVGASLKICLSTCGSIIPTGAKCTLYVNNVAVYTFVVGRC